MSWWISIGTGLVTGTFALFFGFFIASLAADWLKISPMEGAAGYFVVFLALIALMGGLFGGIVISRFVPADGPAPFLRSIGWSVLITGLAIALAGGYAWLSADHEPTVAGSPLDLQFEASLPLSLKDELPPADGRPFVVLYGNDTTRQGSLHLESGHEENGRWIIPGQVNIHNRAQRRIISLILHNAPQQFFDLPLAASPSLMSDWSDWLTAPYFGDLSTPPQEAALALRYRVVKRVEPTQ